MVKVRFKRLRPEAVEPKMAHKGDAGWDLVAVSREWDAGHRVYIYRSGIAVEIPEGYVGLVFPRSSIANRDLLLTNAVGVIDSGYRGEVMAKFGLRGSMDCGLYEVGERFAQLVIMRLPWVDFEEAEELSESERGAGGYGSSGK